MNCHYHPDREALFICAECGENLCEDCKRVGENDEIYCPTCNIKRRIDTSFVANWMREADKENEKEEKLLHKISNDKKITQVLQRYGRKSERLKEILVLLKVSGIGEKRAWKIISNPKELSQFFQMEDEEMEFPEIVLRLMRW